MLPRVRDQGPAAERVRGCYSNRVHNSSHQYHHERAHMERLAPWGAFLRVQCKHKRYGSNHNIRPHGEIGELLHTA